jgi:hypothetical protein
MKPYQPSLPSGQGDGSLMLRTWAVLRKDAIPVLPVAHDFDAARFLDMGCAVARRDFSYRLVTPRDQLGIALILEYAQLPDAVTLGREHAIAEIETQQVDVAGAQAAVVYAVK